ncbi:MULTISPECIES: alpha/beta hydrolase [unclassified Sulfurospirillum]|uniref:alpha/beta fold hydrolase n=1 Tax=unclassified Sulfurospirillum TaxID=2618290 RepID=UPI0005064637|nr:MULTISPECIES: alpha/beta hydrolase [unclassified Sulfurospirillum]KFL35267.1 2-hydroxy-6-oxohepta-2,4-dienoate hydrolase [Sulfurospirillum sp. SCADC]
MAKKEIVFQNSTYALSYELLNHHQPQTILFLHGWGSNKEIMKQAFGTCFPAYQHLYLDLPGFGASSINDVIETGTYADIVHVFLKALHVKPLIIVGHSFGGKVATLLQPDVLVLLSSAGIVAPKSLKIRAKIALFKMLKPFAPKSFYRFFATKDVEGMSNVMYEILKRVVNEDFSEQFLTCKAKSFLFWGKADTATPLSSGEKMHALIKGSHFYAMEGDHFFFIKQAKEIEKTVGAFGW